MLQWGVETIRALTRPLRLHALQSGVIGRE